MRYHIKLAFEIIFLALALCLATSGLALGQEVTGSIVGTIRDSNGGVVKGAKVTITVSDQKIVARDTTTNDDGQFSAPNLASNFYDVTIEAPNFKKHIESRVKLDVG